MQRKRVRIEGIVQGVGFRPFVYQAARRWGIAGWVRNDNRGVLVEAEGDPVAMARFLWALREERPPLASISRFEIEDLPPTGEPGFVILASAQDAGKTAQIAPDSWVCPDCLAELFTPGDRRYRYPFINCTNCGPRYTIVTAIPYDRPNTTMADFPMCDDCRSDYEDPGSRRFHAQPNACPACGPRLRLFSGNGEEVFGDPLGETVARLKEGRIVAVKGVGGYHLAVDAGNEEAVRELRRRKARDEKPFALMSFSTAEVLRYAAADEAELRLLGGPERPIVLLRQKEGHPLAAAVAPRNRFFGVMLPYAPLHYLLLKENFPALVMTSGNLSDEPIAFEDRDAAARLAPLADYLLTHDRRIILRADDSIARVMAGRALLLRRSRGYVPRAVALPRSQAPTLALGAELKNAICLTRDDRAFLSQHIGDLQHPQAQAAFEQTVAHLQRILEIRPERVAYDLHPDYFSSRFGQDLPGLEKVAVQHHHAHLASCLAERGIDEPAIGVIFDGLGYGSDGRLWGGEFLVGDFAGFRRVGHFAYLPMPGGDAAVREPRRMALSALAAAYGEELPPLPVVGSMPPDERRLLLQMLSRGINAPLTSSCGRLFDAVAALCGIREKVSYEGQAALELEQALDAGEQGVYPFDVDHGAEGCLYQPAATIRAIVDDLLDGTPVPLVSARFHNTIANMLTEVCLLVRGATGLGRVALSGGVFQNRQLTERADFLLRRCGFEVLTHSLVPPNDGGLALGQAAVAGRALAP